MTCGTKKSSPRFQAGERGCPVAHKDVTPKIGWFSILGGKIFDSAAAERGAKSKVRVISYMKNQSTQVASTGCNFFR